MVCKMSTHAGCISVTYCRRREVADSKGASSFILLPRLALHRCSRPEGGLNLHYIKFGKRFSKFCLAPSRSPFGEDHMLQAPKPAASLLLQGTGLRMLELACRVPLVDEGTVIFTRDASSAPGPSLVSSCHLGNSTQHLVALPLPTVRVVCQTAAKYCGACITSHPYHRPVHELRTLLLQGCFGHVGSLAFCMPLIMSHYGRGLKTC